MISPELSGHVVFGLLLARSGEDLGGGTDFDQASFVEERSLVGAARRLLHVVRDDRDGILLSQFEDQVFDRERGLGIECRAGLVHEQDLWAHRDRASDTEPLLLASAESQSGASQTILDFVPDRRFTQRPLDSFVEL